MPRQLLLTANVWNSGVVGVIYFHVGTPSLFKNRLCGMGLRGHACGGSSCQHWIVVPAEDRRASGGSSCQHWIVMPAEAGIHLLDEWAPAFAGATILELG